jgi:hypothetical protein
MDVPQLHHETTHRWEAMRIQEEDMVDPATALQHPDKQYHNVRPSGERSNHQHLQADGCN